AVEQTDAIGKLAGQRRIALLKALRSNGVGEFMTIAAAPKLSRDRVVLEIERGIATPPPCPDWSKPAIDYSAQVSSNFGCANATNLAKMAADPTDLLRGNPTARTQGDSAGAAVQAYRDNQAFGTPHSGSPFPSDFYGNSSTSNVK